MRAHNSATSDFNWTWAQSLHDNLENLGMAQVFYDGGFGYSRAFIKQSILLRSEFMFNLNWTEKLRADDTYKYYREIKPYRCLSPYLVELSYLERRAVTRFLCRCNSMPCSDFRRHHDLNVDTAFYVIAEPLVTSCTTYLSVNISQHSVLNLSPQIFLVLPLVSN